MKDLQALLVFTLVMTGTPGPNNTLLWASGLQYGFRRTVPLITGTVLGMAAMLVAVAAGVGAVVAAVPGVELALKVGGTAYLLHLAWRVAGAGAASRGAVGEPLSARQAFAFQFINPKGWVYGLAAMSTFRPDGVPFAAGAAIVVATTVVVVIPVTSVWAAAGTALHGFAERRWVGVVLALLLAASVALIWV